MIDFPLLRAEAAAHPYPLLFATVSGAHLYGFPSPDSDYDLRGVQILPPSEALGLLPRRETIQVEEMRSGIEMDLVTHDVLKFFSMVLKRNGYVLEQLYSPLIVQSSPAHEELKDIATRCVTRHHSHPYLGFAATQWDMFRKEEQPRIKPLLYVYRASVITPKPARHDHFKTGQPTGSGQLVCSAVWSSRASILRMFRLY